MLLRLSHFEVVAIRNNILSNLTATSYINGQPMQSVTSKIICCY